MNRLRGKASSYGGPNDAGDNNRPALQGATNKKPGIAVYNRKTLGGYYRVTAPNGQTRVVQQTDIGPAPFTKRVVDLNPPAGKLFGYKEGNAFPTDQGTWKADYLGKKKPAETGSSSRAPSAKGSQSTATSADESARRQAILERFKTTKANREKADSPAVRKLLGS